MGALSSSLDGVSVEQQAIAMIVGQSGVGACVGMEPGRRATWVGGMSLGAVGDSGKAEVFRTAAGQGLGRSDVAARGRETSDMAGGNAVSFEAEWIEGHPGR